MTWPVWQCGPVAQYKKMGSVSFTVMVKVPTSFASPEKGMWPL